MLSIISADGVISGLSPGAEKVCRQPVFLMDLRTLLVIDHYKLRELNSVLAFMSVCIIVIV
jgi:hypothetical protein